MSTQSKVCTKCKIEKDFSEFHKDKSKKDGCKSDCKQCSNKRYHDLKTDKESMIKAQIRSSIILENKLLKKDGKKICSSCKEPYVITSNNVSICKVCAKEASKKYRTENSEKMKEHFEENREKINKRKRELYEKNKEKLKSIREYRYRNNKIKIDEYREKYRKENREEIRKYQKEYHMKNKEKASAYNREKYKTKKLEELKTIPSFV